MVKELDLLLVNPGARKRVYSEVKSSLWGIEPPLWCGLIAGFIREHGYSVKIIDAEAENWDPEYTLPLPTKYLSAADVLRFRDKAFVKYFSNPKYIEMVKKFGPKVVEHIEEMLKHKIKRKFA